MDYYRRYIGDYLAKTQALTMAEDGAYGRLLDFYYANEAPLPVSLAEVYAIARATTAAERRAVDKVLTVKFELRRDGYHNDRADKELAVALPAMEAKRRTARENGKKGGSPLKKQQYLEPGVLYAFRLDDERIKVGITKYLPQRMSQHRKKNGGLGMLIHAVEVGQMGSAEASLIEAFHQFADGEVLVGADQAAVIAKMDALGVSITQPTSGEDNEPSTHPNPLPILGPTRASQATPSPQPPTRKPTPEKRYHGGEGTGDSAGALGAAALAKLEPPGPEANIATADATPAGMLAAICQRNGITANAFHPLVVEWARDGFTVDQLKAAIATARMPQRKGDGPVPLAYLDPILRDASRPRPKPWKSDDAAASALCTELGIKPAKQGESRDEWHARIEAALADQSRRKVA